jgi:NAD(P)-dependent dehydrogenase (short-subunit alcohol dehydrogenase family)
LKEKAQSVRFVGIGSQAEYGVKSDDAEITENMSLEPFSAYGASKAAMDGAMRCLAKELGEKGIRLNTVQPAATATARKISQKSMAGSVQTLQQDSRTGQSQL